MSDFRITEEQADRLAMATSVLMKELLATSETEEKINSKTRKEICYEQKKKR